MKYVGRVVRTPLLILLVGATIVSGCGNDPKPRVSIPPANTSPQDVVSAYIKAINAHDRAAARKLSTPHFVSEVGKPDGFDNIIEISNLRIENTVPEDDYTSIEGKRYKHAVSVQVTYILKQREEVTREDGFTPSGYILVRDDEAEPWRINDHGGA